MFEYIVIGKGLIGSAAARYLSENSSRVALIGPDEPEDPGKDESVGLPDAHVIAEIGL